LAGSIIAIFAAPKFARAEGHDHDHRNDEAANSEEQYQFPEIDQEAMLVR